MEQNIVSDQQDQSQQTQSLIINQRTCLNELQKIKILDYHPMTLHLIFKDLHAIFSPYWSFKLGPNEISLIHGLSGTKLDEVLTKMEKDIKLHNFNKLTNVKLSWASFKEKKFKRMLKILQTFSNLKTLTIIFESSMSDQEIEILGNQISKNFHSLKQLHLDFENLSMVTDSGIKSLCDLISKSATQLNSFSLELQKHNKITRNGLEKCIATLYGSLNKLKSFNVSLKGDPTATKRVDIAHFIMGRYPLPQPPTLVTESQRKVNGEIFQIFGCKAKRKLAYLENLTLTLKNQGEVMEKSYKIFGCEISKCMPNLKQLTIDFSESLEKVTDQSFKLLGRQLTKGLLHLEKLVIHFKNCFKITDTGLQVFTHEIGANLPNLNNLVLDLQGWSNITDLGLESLSYEICKPKIRLQKLTLLANNWNIIDRGIEVLSTEIVANLQSLQYLKLSFASCEKIGDKALEVFANQLNKRLAHLEHLILDFYGLNFFPKFHKLCIK